jgi:hypothetical protein
MQRGSDGLAAAAASGGPVHYVYSTLACDQLYTKWIPHPQTPPPEKQAPGLHYPPPIKTHEVLIKGGRGLIADHRLITSQGTYTAVTQEQLDILRTIGAFQTHERAGFIRVESTKHDVEKVVADMESGDLSAPLTPADYADDSQEARPSDGPPPRMMAVDRLPLV